MKLHPGRNLCIPNASPRVTMYICHSHTYSSGGFFPLDIKSPYKESVHMENNMILAQNVFYGI
jgi:hypothetical protein